MVEAQVRAVSDDRPRPTGRGSFDELPTEARGAAPEDSDARPTKQLVALMNDEDAVVPAAVGAAADEIAAAIDAIVERLTAGGRLVYVGAGSSGMLAALDAAECQSTFSTAPGEVIARVAGGIEGSPADQAAAEDDAAAGADAIRELGLGGHDAVVGVSASGRTPYVLGALEAAAQTEALTVGIVSIPRSELATRVDHAIVVPVGPEFIAGSTRLKAGTAQKLVLNMISTISMIRLGKTFGDLMVAVQPTNEKLRARAERVVRTATGAAPEDVDAALTAAAGDARVAIVSLLTGVDAERARAKLDEAGGNVRRAVRE